MAAGPRARRSSASAPTLDSGSTSGAVWISGSAVHHSFSRCVTTRRSSMAWTCRSFPSCSECAGSRPRDALHPTTRLRLRCQALEREPHREQYRLVVELLVGAPDVVQLLLQRLIPPAVGVADVELHCIARVDPDSRGHVLLTVTSGGTFVGRRLPDGARTRAQARER